MSACCRRLVSPRLLPDSSESLWPIPCMHLLSISPCQAAPFTHTDTETHIQTWLVGSVCILVIGMLSVPQRQPVPDLQVTHSISARWQELIEVTHTHTRAHILTHTHIAVPLWNWMGLVKSSLPNACWSLSLSLSILWINKRRTDTLHHAQSQLPRSANQSSLPSLPSDCCNDHGRGECCSPTIGAHVGD